MVWAAGSAAYNGAALYETGGRLGRWLRAWRAVREELAGGDWFGGFCGVLEDEFRRREGEALGEGRARYGVSLFFGWAAVVLSYLLGWELGVFGFLHFVVVIFLGQRSPGPIARARARAMGPELGL